ncbi:type VI secretion system tip protein VgrG [Pseudomonas saxonica]|uniref:Type VI secretion system tip protein VgrG n=1 Tax=Pseudomonas saxonica TaxID=2600598 RepID=A0ABY3GEX1_9PSED|nr:type VI secretion system tip protein TssI/VgrG [Pseudomonas saxonica]TWR87674.1 type VI secretion system tip protein VgrG [Pseudomonas saxonica]
MASVLPRFHFSLDGLTDDLHVLAFQGKEAISAPYSFDIELISENPSLDPEGLLHRPGFLAFGAPGGGIHGHVYAVTFSDEHAPLTHLIITLVPQLALLDLRTNQRIFQQLTVEQIISQLLEEHGIFSDAYAFTLDVQYQPRNYCVQYQESDLHFIQRLCEEEGIHYHFQHSPQGHRLVFGDGQRAFPKLDEPVLYHPDSGMVAEERVVNSFKVALKTRPTRSTLRDYNFETASREVKADSHPDNQRRGPDLEDYVYPGHFKLQTRGRLLSQRTLERHRIDCRQATGKSDQPAFATGHLMALGGHPNTLNNNLWLLNEITHQGKQPQVLRAYGTSAAKPSADGFDQGYRNDFIATPWDVPFRPALKHPKPRVLGMQTARVTGPQTDEIHCDEYGRVKVQFHWDRQGQYNDHSSCWLRVASSWAGDTFGAVTVPRVGMEVLVLFLQADPDHPVINACLSNSLTPPPYPLPANKTRSVLRSRSTPDSTGYNELHLEDRKGQERIYLHAQRDMEQRINNDWREQIEGERHQLITGNSVLMLKAEDQLTVSGDRKVQLLANDHCEVANSSHTLAGKLIAIEAGQEITLKSGANLVVTAGATLTLMAAGQHIVINSGGIFSSTPIQLGGAPLPGTAANPLTPMTVEALASVLQLPLSTPSSPLSALPGQKTGKSTFNSEKNQGLSINLRPMPDLPGYESEPYRLLADGVQIQEGITGPDGLVEFKPVANCVTYRVELDNGHHFSMSLDSPSIELPVDPYLAQQGHRAYPTSADPQHRARNLPEDYRGHAALPGKPNEEPDA